MRDTLFHICLKLILWLKLAKRRLVLADGVVSSAHTTAERIQSVKTTKLHKFSLFVAASGFAELNLWQTLLLSIQPSTHVLLGPAFLKPSRRFWWKLCVCLTSSHSHDSQTIDTFTLHLLWGSVNTWGGNSSSSSSLKFWQHEGVWL